MLCGFNRHQARFADQGLLMGNFGNCLNERHNDNIMQILIFAACTAARFLYHGTQKRSNISIKAFSSPLFSVNQQFAKRNHINHPPAFLSSAYRERSSCETGIVELVNPQLPGSLRGGKFVLIEQLDDHALPAPTERKRLLRSFSRNHFSPSISSTVKGAAPDSVSYPPQRDLHRDAHDPKWVNFSKILRPLLAKVRLAYTENRTSSSASSSVSTYLPLAFFSIIVNLLDFEFHRIKLKTRRPTNCSWVVRCRRKKPKNMPDLDTLF